MNTIPMLEGLVQLNERLERAFVWKWMTRGEYSYEVTAESARLRRLEYEERERAKQRRPEKTRFGWVPGA